MAAATVVNDNTFPSKFMAAVVLDAAMDPLPRSIYVGVAGDIALNTADGDTLIFKNAVAGSVLPIRPSVINTINTTATDMIALW